MNSAGRPPYLLVGGILVVIVAALVIAGIVLTQRSRSVAQAQASTGPSVASAVVAPPAAASPVPSPSTAVSASPATSVVASAGLAGLPIASTPEEKAIEAAYQQYLDIYSQAALNLDTSHLSDILAGPALQRVTDEVNQLKAQGRPVSVIETQHKVAFAQVTESTATLIDEYTNESVYADPKTKQPLGSNDQPDLVRQSYQFQKVNNTWKIMDGTRTELSSPSPSQSK